MEKTLCRVVMFCSRNKDNQDIENFEQRRRNFVSGKTNEELISIFKNLLIREFQVNFVVFMSV